MPFIRQSAVTLAGLALLMSVPGAVWSQEPAPASAGLKVILLKPALEFIDFPELKSTGKVVTHPLSTEEKQEYERALINAAKAAAGGKFTVLDTDKIDSPVVAATKTLESLASRMARGSINDETTQRLANLATFDGNYAVLAQFFRLETAAGDVQEHTG